MDVIGTVLPLALVVGLSPLPIMPAVLLLTGPRPLANGLAYLGAWLTTLTLVVVAALLVGGLRDPSPPTDEGIGWVQVVTGVAFLLMAGFKWVRRPGPGSTPEPPRWLAALGAATPPRSARLGALLAGANPKNLVMALAAGAEIAVLTEGVGPTVAGAVAFVLVGSVGVASPILTYAILGARAAGPLETVRAWLDRHSTALSVGVLAVLGALLLLKGLPTAL